MICLPTRNVKSWFESMLKTILTVVVRKNQPMMGNGSTARPLTSRMEEKYVVRVTEKEDPSEKRLMQSQLICHYFVDICCESRGSDRRGGGQYAERDEAYWRVDKCSRLQVQLGLSSVIH